jgi:hypothetical protein
VDASAGSRSHTNTTCRRACASKVVCLQRGNADRGPTAVAWQSMTRACQGPCFFFFWLLIAGEWVWIQAPTHTVCIAQGDPEDETSSIHSFKIFFSRRVHIYIYIYIFIRNPGVWCERRIPESRRFVQHFAAPQKSKV